MLNQVSKQTESSSLADGRKFGSLVKHFAMKLLKSGDLNQDTSN